MIETNFWVYFGARARAAPWYLWLGAAPIAPFALFGLTLIGSAYCFFLLGARLGLWNEHA